MQTEWVRAKIFSLILFSWNSDFRKETMRKIILTVSGFVCISDH